MLKFFYPLLLLNAFILCGCSNDSDTVDSSENPTSLTVEIEVNQEGSGEIEITAIGDNVVEYEFDFGDGTERTSNSTGTISYIYSESGTYEVEVRAFGKSGRFLLETKIISVLVGDDTTTISDEGYKTPNSYDGMIMIWNDEFDGTSLNEAQWNYEIGTGSNGWGNNELQYYRRDNTSLVDGYLQIEARRETFNGNLYTSSRLTTQGKFDFKYGRVDIRAKLPKGQGIWPALWMLGSNFSSVGWPFCGEIDIMELVGGGDGKDNVVHGTVHWDNNGTKADSGSSTRLTDGIFNDEFHVFTIIWDKTEISWFVDDEEFYTINITPTDLSEFQNDFFFIFNVAVGGNWPGSPNTSTVFPQQMLVDYVRVFQDE